MTEQDKPQFEEQGNASGQTPPPIPSQQQQQETQSTQQSYYQGQPAYGQPQSPYNVPPQDNYPPQNYMAMNIVAAVVGILACGNCCISMIIGIVGIVFSSQVNSKFMLGDTRGAESSASTAKILGIVSLVLSGITLIGSIIYYIVLLNSIGGWDAYMEMIQQAVEQSQY